MGEEQAAEQAYAPEPDFIEQGTEEQLAQLYGALATARGAFAAISKSRKVEVKKDNKLLYSYSYAEMDVILAATTPALSANGLAVLQPPSGARIRTILSHNGGARITSIMPIGAVKDIQEFGGDITYLRRYAYNGMLCLAADGDSDDKPNPNRGATSTETSAREPKREPEVPAQEGEQRPSPTRAPGRAYAPTAADSAATSTRPDSQPPPAAPAAVSKSGLNPLQQSELAKLGRELGATSAQEAVKLVYEAAGEPVTAANFKEKLAIVQAAVAARTGGAQ